MRRAAFRATCPSSSKPSYSSGCSIGLGWRTTEFRGLKEVAHGGAQQRVSTYLYLCPERGLAVALLSNLEKASPKRLAYAIARLYLDT